MALIKCPKCGKEVSDKAKKCIHCKSKIYKNRQSRFFIGVMVGVIISGILMFGLYIILNNKKIEDNNSKCLSTFTYNEENDLCIQSNMLMPNNDGSCDDDYIYDDYDDKCYKYIITPPLNNDNLTYEENIERLNGYINQQ